MHNKTEVTTRYLAVVQVRAGKKETLSFSRLMDGGGGGPWTDLEGRGRGRAGPGAVAGRGDRSVAEQATRAAWPCDADANIDQLGRRRRRHQHLVKRRLSASANLQIARRPATDTSSSCLPARLPSDMMFPSVCRSVCARFYIHPTCGMRAAFCPDYFAPGGVQVLR